MACLTSALSMNSRISIGDWRATPWHRIYQSLLCIGSVMVLWGCSIIAPLIWCEVQVTFDNASTEYVLRVEGRPSSEEGWQAIVPEGLPPGSQTNVYLERALWSFRAVLADERETTVDSADLRNVECYKVTFVDVHDGTSNVRMIGGKHEEQ